MIPVQLSNKLYNYIILFLIQRMRDTNINWEKKIVLIKKNGSINK